MRREAWIVSHEMSTAVMNMNALFCEKDGDEHDGDEYEPQIKTQEEINEIAEMIAKKTDSPFALEDTLLVLTCALDILKKKDKEKSCTTH